jgi:hypothetical protein
LPTRHTHSLYVPLYLALLSLLLLALLSLDAAEEALLATDDARLDGALVFGFFFDPAGRPAGRLVGGAGWGAGAGAGATGLGRRGEMITRGERGWMVGSDATATGDGRTAGGLMSAT